MNIPLINAVIAFLAICISLQGRLIADEIIISGNEHAVTVGDFDFSPCNTESQEVLALLGTGSSGQMTTGALWQFFADNGIDSVENLTICMDWSPEQQLYADIDVSSLQLKIEDPNHAGGLITNVSLGEDSLVIPGFEFSSFKPEAKLGVALGYDFMKRFGPQSKEKIHLDFGEPSQAGFMPTFTFEGSAANPSRIPNWFGLFGFIIFWLVVFKCLAIVTAPKAVAVEPASPAPGDIISA